MGGGGGGDWGYARASRIGIAQSLGHRQLWEGLSLDKKLQRGINS